MSIIDVQNRCYQLLEQAYSLLKEVENTEILSSDPLERARLHSKSEWLKKFIERAEHSFTSPNLDTPGFKAEFDKLERELKNIASFSPTNNVIEVRGDNLGITNVGGTVGDVYIGFGALKRWLLKLISRIAKPGEQLKNPGWHLVGVFNLIWSGLFVTALLILLYMLALGLPFVLQMGVGLFVVLLFCLTGLSIWLVSRLDSYFGQRLSHFMAEQFVGWAMVLLLPVSAAGLWWWFGMPVVQKELLRQAVCRPYLASSPQTPNVALLEQDKPKTTSDADSSVNNLDSYSLYIVNKILLGYNLEVTPWVVSANLMHDCEQYFRYKVELNNLDLPATEDKEKKFKYTAFVYEQQPDKNFKLKTIQDELGPALSSQDCGIVDAKLARLGYGIAKLVGVTSVPALEDPALQERIKLAAQKDCEILKLNEDGFQAYNTKPYNYDKAEILLKEAVERDPNYAVAHNNLGLVYFRKGQYEKAIEEARKAVELVPNYPLFLTNLGQAYYWQRIYDCADNNTEDGCAVRILERAIKIRGANDQPYVLAFIRLAAVYSELNRFEQAQIKLLEDSQNWLKVIEDGREVRRLQAELDITWAIFYLKKANPTEAIKKLEHALKMGPTFEEEIYYLMAQSYEKSGNTAKACETWQGYEEVLDDIEKDKRRNLPGEAERRTEVSQRKQATCNF